MPGHRSNYFPPFSRPGKFVLKIADILYSCAIDREAAVRWLSRTNKMALTWATAQYIRICVRQIGGIYHEIPAFLCPALSKTRQNISGTWVHPSSRRPFSHSNKNSLEQNTYDSVPLGAAANDTRLPLQCSGCGAFSQTANKYEAGYYSLGRRHVRAFMGQLDGKASRKQSEAELVQESLHRVGGDIAETLRGDIVNHSGRLQTIQSYEPT